MTARPPLETLEAASEESPESPSAGEPVVAASNGLANEGVKVERDLATGASSEGREGSGEGSEASISKTLEALLSKTDDDEAPFSPDDEGLPTAGGAIGPGAASRGEAEPSISVDAMFDVDVDLDHDHDERPRVKALAPPVEERPVSDVLDEVAQALNVQAAESRERALGRAPDALAPAQAPEVASTPLVAATAEFEFEDPEDGPTTLNSSDDGANLAAANSDDEEEAVVLGPATRRGDSRPHATLPGVSARATLPAPPMPGSRAPGTSRPHIATPFAGLPAATLPTFPAPGSGRARLPTPTPGYALGLPSPTGVRSAPPNGSPLSEAVSSPSLGMADSSRRTTRVSSSLTALAAGGSEAPGGSHHGLVGEPLSAALSSASTILKKDVRFRIASLAAIVVVTFTGGILIGRAVLRGKDDTDAPAVARATEPSLTAPAPAPAPAKVAAAAAPVGAATSGEAPKIEPVAAPPTVAEASPQGVGPMQFDPQPIHKRRARRVVPAPKDDLGLAAPPAPKASGPVRVASAAGPSGAKAPPTAAKLAPKKKSTWHDPFAD